MRRLPLWAASCGLAYYLGTRTAQALFDRYCLPLMKEFT